MSTFDSLVEEKLNFFKERKVRLPTLKEEMEAEADPDRKEALAEEISDIETGKSEVDYLLKVAPLLKQYTLNEPRHPAGRAEPMKGTLDSVVKTETLSHRREFFYRYMTEVEEDEAFYKQMSEEGLLPGQGESMATAMAEYVCEQCSGTLVREKDFRTCVSCGTCFPIWESGEEGLTYEQRINEVVTVYTYRRSAHFSEWLSKLQGREMTSVPEPVLEAVKSELKKARILDSSDIDHKTIKFYLKKLKLSKFYEHVPQITQVLTGKKPPTFTTDLETKLRQMFDEIQAPFDKVRPSGRSNFLSYGYCLYKMCELLGEDEYLPFLPLLKSFSKLHQQDLIWKDICAILKWEFIPSV
jgi:hypothetical protein